MQNYFTIIKEYIEKNYQKCLREADDKFLYPFIVPGAVYSNEMWDWDSWLVGKALYQVGDNIDIYEKGCVLNYLKAMDSEGRIPVVLSPCEYPFFDLIDGVEKNIHKPCLAQHALQIVEKCGDLDWLKGDFNALMRFVDWYILNCRHEETGLYFWINDAGIGIDNEPCVFYRPNKSSASVFLNCLMYKELQAMSALCEKFQLDEQREKYSFYATELEKSIQSECWDERDKFFYGVDISLRGIDANDNLHRGAPRAWKSLPIRIMGWSGFIPLWCGIATKEQADILIKERLLNESLFKSPNGIRSLSKAEKMYEIKATDNPSCWLGPIWGCVNWIAFQGLLNYGYVEEAKELAETIVKLFAKDIEMCGELHEYYNPETGEGVTGLGFQSWNLLVIDMIKFLEEQQLK